MKSMYLQIAIVCFFLVCGNLLLKLHFTHHPLGDSFQVSKLPSIIASLLFSLFAWGSLLSILIAVCAWIFVISKHPLSLVYPMVSLVYVMMLFADWIVFGVQPTITKIAGVILVCVRILLVSQ